MAADFDVCSGFFSDVQKKLFNGFPLATLSSHPCANCGRFIYPERRGTDWVPATHSANFNAPQSPMSTTRSRTN
jgi:hypothetical protein